MKAIRYDAKILACDDSARARFWNQVTKSDGCWLYGSNPDAYGKFWVSGVNVQAHRAAKLWQTGAPKPATLLARHLCKSKSCCRPEHLEWGTVAQNARDRIRDGTNRPLTHRHELHPNAILNKKSARAICEKYNRGDISAAALARTYGVTAACVFRVIRRQTWSDATSDIPIVEMPRKLRGHCRGVKHHARRLNEARVCEIKHRLSLEENQYAIARFFGVSQSAISDIKHGRTWTHIAMPAK